MEPSGIIRRSSSNWTSPLLLVPKADGSRRPCGDYIRLNNAILPVRYPVSHIQDFNSPPQRLHNLLQAGRDEGILPGTDEPTQHPQNPRDNIVRPVRVPGDALEAEKQTFQRFMDQGTPFLPQLPITPQSNGLVKNFHQKLKYSHQFSGSD